MVDCNGNAIQSNVDQNQGAVIDWSKINPVGGIINEEANRKMGNDAMLLEKRMMV